MSIIQLPGLSGSNTLGAMAAFGLFRSVAREQPFGIAKLSWYFDADWRPQFHFEQESEFDGLVQFFIDRQPARTKALFINWHDDIKTSPEAFRELWQTVQREFATDSDSFSSEEVAAFLTAYGSEMIIDKKAKPDVKPTAFHMTAGQQRFLSSVGEIANSLDPQQRAGKRQSEHERLGELRGAYTIALQGPWTYADSNHSLGWDPATEGLYALSDVSPSESGPRSVRAAVWLAFESLPLFPSVPVGNRLRTTSFDIKSTSFKWPIWTQPMTIETLTVILGSNELQQEPPDTQVLRVRGIQAIMRSQCVRDANNRGTFRNAISLC